MVLGFGFSSEKWGMGGFGAYEASRSFRQWAPVSTGAGTTTGKEPVVGVGGSCHCLVMPCGRDSWKLVWGILAIDLVFRTSNISTECPSCVLPTPVIVT